ncbi:MAG: PD40 domain-containing protein [Acidobacteria bacterium]|nr:PD40 domain-containing protein [Acidobacteriota bacterium]
MKAVLRRIGLPIAIVMMAVMIWPSAQFGAQKRLITETDLFKFVWIADPQISPDGSKVIFVRNWVNQKADRYDTALWVVPTGGGPARQLTAGPRDSSPRWSPDGRWIAFIRSAEKEGRPQPPQIYLLSFDGGEAQPLTEMTRGAAGIEWSPDGKTIAFASSEDLKNPRRLKASRQKRSRRSRLKESAMSASLPGLHTGRTGRVTSTQNSSRISGR